MRASSAIETTRCGSSRGAGALPDQDTPIDRKVLQTKEPEPEEQAPEHARAAGMGLAASDRSGGHGRIAGG
ncbi:hypothetical protein GCM10017653_12930 [Ancylobacter defluvii]|uniref:Uncharacterized protein n=1 Tax=Ancylobacter defluvii TaxID=1282440 RepID=A0A9W6JWK0_9HYPH|nr:hypothetical protein GCM10017653_12930 [Ancylobacter defluvii]